jgi:hypothetical protein
MLRGCMRWESGQFFMEGPFGEGSCVCGFVDSNNGVACDACLLSATANSSQ